VIVILAGVSGCGKTTVGQVLARWLDWPFTDGDLLHPAANIAKMARGEPLTDEDRTPWLRAIVARLDDWIAADQPGLLACSALKRRYRAMLLEGRPAAKIAFLRIDRAVAAKRLASRHGHFFKPELLDSQFADLESPGPDEAAVVVVPSEERPEVTAREVIRRFDLEGATAAGPGPASPGPAGTGFV
jgi:gluconokinase